MKGLLTKQLALATLFCLLIAQCAMAVSFNAPMGNTVNATRLGGAQRIIGLYATQPSPYATVQARTPQMDAWYKQKLAERDRKKAWLQTKLPVMYKRGAMAAIPASHTSSGIPVTTVTKPVTPANSTATPTV